MSTTTGKLGFLLCLFLGLGCSTSSGGDSSGTTPSETIKVSDGGEAAAVHPTGTIVQFGTLEQLNVGDYEGPTTVADVANAGDFGLGTYEALDGEMIVLDGTVYRFTSDGVLAVAAPTLIVPFAAVTNHFQADTHVPANAPLADFAAMQAFLTNALTDARKMYALRVHATFASIKTRAPRRQTMPFPPLDQAVLTQVEFTRTNIAGTLVGFRFPAYFGTLNAVGYHLHFVSDDKTFGGHVLDVATGGPVVIDVQTLEKIDVNLALEGRGPP